MTYLTSRVCRALAFVAVVIVALGFLADDANAHQSPYSSVLLDFYQDGVIAQLTLPLQELEIGFGKPLLEQPDEVVPKYRAELESYLRAHINPVAPDGRNWNVEVRDLKVNSGEQPIDLIAKVWMQPPPGAPLRRFTFNYSVVNHEVMSHYAFVSVRNDWDTATFATAKPEPLGVLHFTTKSIEVDRTRGSWWQGFDSVFKLGLRHIAEGTDHLLFLLVLLLPAPLVAYAGRWDDFGGLRRSIFQLLKIVSAFTIGHSLTLALGATGLVVLPSRPVEVLIALSILVSAIHALRPIFPGKEMWIAAGFGLVHGLAFAGSVAQYGFSPWHLAYTILAFNLGIEAMQLLVVGVTIPWLILLSQTKSYSVVRITGAAFAGFAAIGWIGERALALRNPFEATVEFLAAHALWIIACLAAFALFSFAQARKRA